MNQQYKIIRKSEGTIRQITPNKTANNLIMNQPAFGSTVQG